MNLTTKLHYYHYDFTIPAHVEAYEELKANMKANGVRMSVCAMPTVYSKEFNDYWDKVKDRGIQFEITLDTKFVFEDQWNEAGDGGLRLMDWEDVTCPNPNIRFGYWLELTDEMLAVREHTHKCGYCGKQMDAREGMVPTFCPKCIGSDTLKPENLHLLRMLPVTAKGPRLPLTEAERATLVPAYKKARIEGHTERDKKRLIATRERILQNYEETMKGAVVERDGKLWLLDNGIDPHNAIYYKHRDVFAFGWNRPISTLVLDDLIIELKDFPFDHEIVCTDGTTIPFKRES